MNESIISPLHPYWFVRSLVENETNIKSLRLSYYEYHPQSLQDDRQVFDVPRDFFLHAPSIDDFLNHCPKNSEVSINSTIDCFDGIERHIPMIDLSTSSRAHLKKLLAYLGESVFYGFSWYESGRSFHGYGSRLLTKSEWIEFMGILLLSNQKDLKPTVDPRWIGHRLIGGYSALRWTKNTYHYLNFPSKI